MSFKKEKKKEKEKEKEEILIYNKVNYKLVFIFKFNYILKDIIANSKEQ
jgi:hypothetical protein